MDWSIIVLADLIVLVVVLLPVFGLAFYLEWPDVHARRAATAGIRLASGAVSQVSTAIVVAPTGLESSPKAQECGRVVVVALPGLEVAPQIQPAALVDPAAAQAPPHGTPPPAEHPERRALVICVADTPWGNAGEALIGKLAEFGDGQEVLRVADDSGVIYNVPLPEPCVHIQELSPI